MCVMESGAHRPAGDPEQLGDFDRGVTNEVVKHEDCPFVGRESPEGTVQLVAVGHAEEVVRGGRAVARQDVEVCDAATFARRLADAHVGEDTVEPAAEPVRIAEARQVTPGDHQCVLQSILGPSDVPEDPVGDREEPVAAKPHQVDERDLVAPLCRLDEIDIHAHHRGLTPVGGVVRGYRQVRARFRWKRTIDSASSPGILTVIGSQ